MAQIPCSKAMEMAESMDALLQGMQTGINGPNHSCTPPRMTPKRASGVDKMARGAGESRPTTSGEDTDSNVKTVLLGPIGTFREKIHSACSSSDLASETGELVTINVGGARFVTFRSTLERIPGTRLSNLQRTDRNFNPATNEWFFDRNPALFNFLLDYYRSNELHFPHNFCGPSIRKELIYWKIDESEISTCCWNRYREFEQEKKIFERIEQAFESGSAYQKIIAEDIVNASQWHLWKRRIYLFLEEPMSSRAAQVRALCVYVCVCACVCMHVCVCTLRAESKLIQSHEFVCRINFPRTEEGSSALLYSRFVWLLIITV